MDADERSHLICLYPLFEISLYYTIYNKINNVHINTTALVLIRVPGLMNGHLLADIRRLC